MFAVLGVCSFESKILRLMFLHDLMHKHYASNGTETYFSECLDSGNSYAIYSFKRGRSELDISPTFFENGLQVR